LARTSHGSTLSSVVNAWVLARYQPEEAWRFLQRALDSDVADVQGGTTAEGVHLGAMAGTVDIVLRCLTGLRPRGEVLRFNPAVPPQIQHLRFSVHYRGHRVDVEFADGRLAVGSRPGPARPITVLVGRDSAELRPGGRLEFALHRP
jgi:trehalose/maltose hydrolase-like predicted phosphorylase